MKGFWVPERLLILTEEIMSVQREILRSFRSPPRLHVAVVEIGRLQRDDACSHLI